MYERMLKGLLYRTNNWSDFGGMDVYVKALTGSSNHDLFYTDAKVIVRIILLLL
jgi:mannan endo-1,4-beta-mannosidase